MVIRTTAAARTASAAYSKTLSVLQESVFPRVVTYATHPLTITCTILLLVPLILDASNTSLALVLGNYTNVVSASVSSIVLLQSVHHIAHTRAMHQEHREEIAKLHQKIDALTVSTQTTQKASTPDEHSDNTEPRDDSSRRASSGGSGRKGSRGDASDGSATGTASGASTGTRARRRAATTSSSGSNHDGAHPAS